MHETYRSTSPHSVPPHPRVLVRELAGQRVRHHTPHPPPLFSFQCGCPGLPLSPIVLGSEVPCRSFAHTRCDILGNTCQQGGLEVRKPKLDFRKEKLPLFSHSWDSELLGSLTPTCHVMTGTATSPQPLWLGSSCATTYIPGHS